MGAWPPPPLEWECPMGQGSRAKPLAPQKCPWGSPSVPSHLQLRTPTPGPPDVTNVSRNPDICDVGASAPTCQGVTAASAMTARLRWT